MPTLYSLAQWPELKEVQSQLRGREAILAHFDDTCSICSPERVCEFYEAHRRALWAHARVEVNRTKTRIWSGQEEPRGISALQTDPDAAVCMGTAA